MDMTKRAVPVVMTELRTIIAMMSSTNTMLMVSAVYCHARPLAKMRAIKIDRLHNLKTQALVPVSENRVTNARTNDE